MSPLQHEKGHREVDWKSCGSTLPSLLLLLHKTPYAFRALTDLYGQLVLAGDFRSLHQLHKKYFQLCKTPQTSLAYGYTTNSSQPALPRAEGEMSEDYQPWKI